MKGPNHCPSHLRNKKEDPGNYSPVSLTSVWHLEAVVWAWGSQESCEASAEVAQNPHLVPTEQGLSGICQGQSLL